MVSPSKIFKTSNNGFKVGIDSSKKDGLKTQGVSRQKSLSSSQVKNPRLLANTKFYLDIRNRTHLAKVESTLKSYGAKIEVFFWKGVNIVVTDRAEWIGSGQSPNTSISPLTTPSPSSNQDQRFVLPKSRASAMLEKVSRQPAFPYSSALELAQKWRIPVLPIPSLWKWIGKVEEAFITKLNEKKKEKEFLESKIVICTRDSPFIKIESFVSKMTRRPAKNNVVSNEDETANVTECKQNLSPICNGHAGRSITRQSSQELLKVQCNGLTTSHRNSKLLSPSGSDVLPLPTSRRSTRRASASWCGSTRELSQLSPTDSEIENIRRSESSFEAHDPALDSPGITLRPKGQLWLPIALIGTTAEENGNCVRKRYDYSIRQSENTKLSSELLDSIDEKVQNESEDIMPKESDSSFNSNSSSQNEYQIKRNADKKDTYCIITRNTKIKNDEMNDERSRETSVESNKSAHEQQPKSRTDGKKRSQSVCGRSSPLVKRARTMSTNSVHSVGRKKKLSPEEKLLQDNKDYFKMEVLNTKLRSSGSLLNVNHSKEPLAIGEKPMEKIDKIIIKKIKVRGRRRKNRWTKANDKKELDYTTIIIEDKKNNKVKINGVIKKKQRQSELMKLCNEAESFMFGESSRQGSTAESELEEPFGKRKSCSNKCEETSTDINCESERKVRKKRRSHAEAFIHDNLDYYKFETPGSRLRYQGNFLDVKSEDKDFIYTLKQKKKERLSTEQNKKNELLEKLQLNVAVKEEKVEEKKRNPVKPSEEIEKILFSFESIPVTEPWYEVYKRQDEGLENYYPLLSDPNDQPFLLPYELPKPSYPKVPPVSEYYKRRRKKLAHLFNHPRKSPRCHASTLAILSSLKKRKRRSGTHISMSAVLAESPPTNSNPQEEKLEGRHSDGVGAKGDAESEEILSFLFEKDSDGEMEEILLEPLSDSESKPKRKNSDSGKSVKSDEDEGKVLTKTGTRCKKSKMESQAEALSVVVSPEETVKQFSLQSIKPEEEFFKDLTIETRKKSGLKVNIATILENFKNCRSMDESNVDLMLNELKGVSGSDKSHGNARRKRKKARKINKTGWDNRKSRRRTVGNKVTEVKEVECEETVSPKRIKTKVKVRDKGISSENIIVGSKKRIRKREGRAKSEEDRPVLRSQNEMSDRVARLRRGSQDSETRSDSLDSASRDYPPCTVRVKKISDSGLTSGPVKLKKCSNGRYTLQKRLVLSRKKKRVIDYAWTTRKR